MKYVLNIMILFICVFLLLIIDNDYISAPVVSLDSDYYQMYDIYADNLTTKNFTKYFSDTSNFIAVYPDIAALSWRTGICLYISLLLMPESSEGKTSAVSWK